MHSLACIYRLARITKFPPGGARDSLGASIFVQKEKIVPKHSLRWCLRLGIILAESPHPGADRPATGAAERRSGHVPAGTPPDAAPRFPPRPPDRRTASRAARPAREKSSGNSSPRRANDNKVMSRQPAEILFHVFGSLPGHVESNLLHNGLDHRMDAVGIQTGAKHVESVAGMVPQEGLGHLTSRRVPRAEDQDISSLIHFRRPPKAGTIPTGLHYRQTDSVSRTLVTERSLVK